MTFDRSRETINALNAFLVTIKMLAKLQGDLADFSVWILVKYDSSVGRLFHAHCDDSRL
jgi:hypothetical protein